MKNKTIRRAALLAAGGLLACALDVRLRSVRYELVCARLSARVRLLFLSDLHACRYGKGQAGLIKAVNALEPHALLFGGDMLRDARRDGRAFSLFSALSARYPSFYVSGNHEMRCGYAKQAKARIRDCGVRVLEGESALLRLPGGNLHIGGVDDPAGGSDAAFRSALLAAASGKEAADASVLLSHRPERILQYLPLGFDLVLCGHAHGGQWRIPGLLNGLFAPNQGLFPRYAGGKYDFGGSSMVVSRGLARESTLVPRIFNRPELVVLDLCTRRMGA